MIGVDAAVEILGKEWIREQTHLLADLGFPNASKLEFLDGKLIDCTGKSIRMFYGSADPRLAVGQVRDGCVRMQSPIDVSAEDNEPSEPDLISTSNSIRDYSTNVGPKELKINHCSFGLICLLRRRKECWREVDNAVPLQPGRQDQLDPGVPEQPTSIVKAIHIHSRANVR